MKKFALFLFVLILGTGSAFAQFETRSTFPVSGAPYSAVVGDFNGDGVPDLAVLAFLGGQVAVALGNGDGTFSKPTYYNALASSLAAGDFRNDGILDLALTDNLSNNLQVMLGNGNGTFGPSSYYSTPDFPNLIAVGDFNNDGKLDVLTVDQSGYCPCMSVLLGNGDGTFQAPIITQPPGPAAAIGLGDFNGDGNLDVVTAGQFGSSNDIGILYGNGDGTFTDGPIYQASTSPQSVAVADFNGDHILDLAVANAIGGSVEILLGNGDGTFRYGPVYAAYFPVDIQAVDLNGDGKLDLAYESGVYSTVANVLTGNGDGTFRRGGSYQIGFESVLFSADLNGDGQPDFILLNYLGNQVVIWLNTGAVSFSPMTPLTFGAQVIGSNTPQTVTLTNNGRKKLSIQSITLSGPFSKTSTCGSSVAPHASCTLTVTFSPTTTGVKSGLISIVDSASSKPQAIELIGAGTVVAITPTQLTFPAQKVGTKSVPQAVTVTNTASTTLNIQKISIEGLDSLDFAEGNTCGSTLGAGTSCRIWVAFDPTKTGTRTATLGITDSGGGSPQQVSLSGTGD